MKTFENQNYQQDEIIRKANYAVQDDAIVAQRKEKFLQQYLNKISRKNKNLFGRLTLTGSQKELLRDIEEKEKELSDRVLNERNDRIVALAHSQTLYVKELCNTILQIGRSNLQNSVKAVFTENFLSLTKKLEIHNEEFLEMIREKIENATTQPKAIQDIIFKQIDHLTDQWLRVYDAVVGDMLSILYEKV